MNIVYIANVRIPTERAHGMQIVKMCEEFANLGKSVNLMVPKRDNPIEDTAFDYYKIKENFKVTYLSIFDAVGRKIKYGHWINQFFFTLAVLFCGQIGNKKETLVFTRDEIVGWLLAKLGYRVVYDMHGFPDKNLWFWKMSMGSMEKIIGTNKWKLDQCHQKFEIDWDKMIVAPNGFDENLFKIQKTKEEIRQEFGLSLDRKVIVYTGHLYDWKGAHTLAQSAIDLPEYDFIFVGGVEKDVADFKNKYGAHQNIKILGHKPHYQIPLYLKASDLLVLPNSATSKEPRFVNYTQFDTSPIKLFEYMASGQPIVVSDLPSVKEIVNEDSAVFFTPDDSDDLVKAIEKVFGNRELAEKISTNSLIKSKDLSWHRRAEKIINFMDNKKSKTIGFVTAYNAKSPAGLERSAFEIIRSFITNDNDNFYNVYTKIGSGLKEELSAVINKDNYKVIEIGFGKFWREIGLFFASKSDLYVFNGQVAPLVFRPKESYIIVYDLAYKHFKTESFKKKLKNIFSDISIKLGAMSATKMLAISQHTKYEMNKFFGIKPEKVGVIYLGFNDIEKKEEEKFDLASDDFFFFASTIKERKNVFNLVKGFKIFCDQLETPFKLILAGKYNKEDNYVKKIFSYIADNKLEEKIVFAGHMKDKQLAYLYRNARAVVYPSFLEGFGLPILEAMGFGTPVITSGIGATKEVAGDAGLLVDPYKPEDIARAMREITTDDELRRRLIEAGPAQIEKFTWKRVAERFLDIIDS